MKQKILNIAPHLSTGGMPQYLYKQLELLKDDFDLYCVEWENVTGGVLVVQRNKIVNLLGDKLITLGEDKSKIFDIIKNINPDIVHLQEIPELFMSYNIAEKLYSKDRKYVIIETSHDSSQVSFNKKHFPDKFLFVSQYQIEQYKNLGIPCDVVEYPIEYFSKTKTKEQAQKHLGMNPNLKHIINVGLFTPRKNQAEIIEYAKMLKDYPVQFHFIGNQADNFKYYWEPLMKDFPSNCKWWNERTDVENFYQAADLFLFTSRGSEHDKETMPLVIREAISWQVPSLIYNLPVYMNYFNKFDNINYLNFDSKKQNSELILEKVNLIINNRLNELLTEIRMSYGGINKDKAEGANELYGLFNLIKQHTNTESIVVEIGAFEGKSTELFALLCKKVYSIDPYEPYPDIHPSSLAQAENIFLKMQSNYNNIEKIKKFSVEACKNFEDNSIDLVYIDGAHDYESVKLDIINWLPKVKIGGIISGHDFNSIQSVRKAVEEIFPNEKIYTYEDSSWAIVNNKSKNNMETQKKYPFQSKWDAAQQIMYFMPETNIDFPIIVSIKEYKSDSVFWSFEYSSIPANIELWMVPITKEVYDYENHPNVSGVKLCIYKKDTGEQIYEKPYFNKFVSLPVVTLSNSIPYHFNYTEFFVDKKYEKFFSPYYKNVVDVGANVGVFTKYMIDTNKTSKVISVECDPTALKDLTKNFHTDNRVEIIDKALHYSNEPIKFYSSDVNPVISSTLAPEKLEYHNAGTKGDNETIVRTITIKNLVEKLGEIDLLKIDIEGAEYSIIENTDTDTLKNINQLFIECHFFEHDYKEKYFNMINKLKNCGFAVEEYYTNQSDFIGKSEVISAKRLR